MARRGIALIGVLALLCLGACSNDKNTNAVRIGFIEGRVTLDGVGIPGVVVAVTAYQMTDNGPSKAAEPTETSAIGDYSLELLPGQYRLDYAVYHNGLSYYTARYPIELSTDAHINLDVELKDPAPKNLIVRDDDASVYISIYRGYGVYVYRVYRSPAGSNNFQEVMTLTSGNEQYTGYDLPPEPGNYKYKVTGVLDEGETDFSNEATVIFTATIFPPRNFTAEDNLTNVELSWSEKANAALYKIYRAAGNGSWNLLTSTSARSYIDVPQSYNTYRYRLTAVSSYGSESTPAAEVTINYDGRLEPPTGVLATDQGAILYISWNRSGNGSQYNIYRSLISDDDFVKIDSTNNLYYSDRPSLDHTYYYRISAVAPNGTESGLSQAASALFDGLLEHPTHITVEDFGLYLLLRWDPVQWAGAYIIYRSDDGGEVYNQIGRTDGFTYAYTDRPSAGDKYYKIATETGDGIVGILSPPVIIPFSDNLLPPTFVQAHNQGLRTQVFWQSAIGATGYAVYRAPHPDGDYVVIRNSVTETSIIDEPSIADTYYYRVESFDDQDHRSPMSDYAYVYFTAFPEPPVTVTASDQRFYTGVIWQAAAGVTTYIVFKSVTSYGDYTVVDTVSETQCIDWPAEAGHIYYKVKSVDGARVSEFSDFAHVYFSGILSAPDDLTGGDNGSSVVLYWNEVPYVSEYDVYRGDNPNLMILNQTVYTPTASDTPDTAGVYYYGVVARTQGGLQSPMSTPILVQFNP